MDSDIENSMVERVYAELCGELGTLCVRKVKGSPGPIAYCPPAFEHPLLVFSHRLPLGVLLRIEVPVADRVDWSAGDLSSLLLAEQSKWAFGRAERRKEGIVIEHCILADTATETLGRLLTGLADTALRLRGDLLQMGALTVPEEASS